MATAPHPRNRTDTEGRILDAARRVIARDGFAALGVNALAAEAGCDKKLIARYFGGIDGVVEALGGAAGFWTGGDPPPAAPGDGYAERMEALLAHYRAALRDDPLLQRVLAAEVADPSPALARMNRARDVAMAGWMGRARGALAPPPGVDAPAVNAIILAALHYLTLRERTLGDFAGIELSTEAGQERIASALRLLLRRGLQP